MMFDLGHSTPQLTVASPEPKRASDLAPRTSRTDKGSREESGAVPPPSKGVKKGWLIELTEGRAAWNKTESPLRLFLQIGTGQWCGAEYATLFPLRRTAIVYAREFGLLADKSVQFVEHES